jgi:chromosome segregation ATPase
MDDLLRQIQRLQVREIEVHHEKSRQDKIYLGKISELERDVFFFRKRAADLEEKFRIVSIREGESDDIRTRLEARVTDELGRMSSEINRLRRLLAVAGDDYSRLVKNYDDLESKHRSSICQLEVLTRQAQQKDSDMRALTANLDEKRDLWTQEERQKGWEQIRQIQTQKASELMSLMNEKESELLSVTERHNAEILALRHEQTVVVARLQEEVRRLREQNDALGGSLEMCKIRGEKELGNFRRQLEAKQWELDKSSGELRGIMLRVEGLETEHQELVTEHSKTLEKLGNTQTRLQAAEMELIDSEKWAAHLNEDISRLESLGGLRSADAVRTQYSYRESFPVKAGPSSIEGRSDLASLSVPPSTGIPRTSLSGVSGGAAVGASARVIFRAPVF